MTKWYIDSVISPHGNVQQIHQAAHSRSKSRHFYQKVRHIVKADDGEDMNHPQLFMVDFRVGHFFAASNSMSEGGYAF